MPPRFRETGELTKSLKSVTCGQKILNRTREVTYLTVTGCNVLQNRGLSREISRSRVKLEAPEHIPGVFEASKPIKRHALGAASAYISRLIVNRIEFRRGLPCMA